MNYCCPECGKNFSEHEVLRLSGTVRMCQVCKGPCFAEEVKLAKAKSGRVSQKLSHAYEASGDFSKNLKIIIVFFVIGVVFFYSNKSLSSSGGAKNLEELKFELFKNEMVIAHWEESFAAQKKAVESMPACPRTGERPTFELSSASRVKLNELNEANTILRSKIRALESKGIRCKKSDADIKSGIHITFG